MFSGVVVKEGNNESNYDFTLSHNNGLILEVTSDSNLFFHYVICLDTVSYLDFCKKNQISVDLDVFIEEISHIFASIKEKEEFFYIVIDESEDNTKIFSFYQIHPIIDIFLFSLEFHLSSRETQFENAKQKYNMIKESINRNREKLNIMNSIIKKKNPHMMKYIETKPKLLISQKRDILMRIGELNSQKESLNNY